ncbi:hypothetical protein, partial [Serratia ureilytica]
ADINLRFPVLFSGFGSVKDYQYRLVSFFIQDVTKVVIYYLFQLQVLKGSSSLVGMEIAIIVFYFDIGLTSKV